MKIEVEKYYTYCSTIYGTAPAGIIHVYDTDTTGIRGFRLEDKQPIRIEVQRILKEISKEDNPEYFL